MGEHLINTNYLSQLQNLALEQNEEALVAGLVKNAELEYSQFLVTENELVGVQSVSTQEVLRRVHKLKNCFSNIGAEKASRFLDELYQELEKGMLVEGSVQEHWTQFKKVADLTFSELSKVIN